MILSKGEKLILRLIITVILFAIFMLSFTTIIKLWKSGYIEEGQSLSSYNSLELDTLEFFENSFKSISFKKETELEKVFLYISKKNQNYLTSNLPYSTRNWVNALVLDDRKLKDIQVRHRGDNPDNWLHKKKSWRVKRKKSDLKDGTRVFDYLLPRDSSLINTYLGYFIAEKIGIPTPDYRFVELYINDRYEGLYLELERIDENFLRRNNFMPVNIYKGTPSRTDRPLNQDNDLFNNPFLWEKRATFNARESEDFSDLEIFLNLIRESVNNNEKMKSLEKLANVEKWANFSAYETIMQSWHNYEKNNMYLISDPWINEIIPIALDTIFNDTKSELSVNEKVNLDNSAHALMEVYTNNSKFLYLKYKIIDSYIENGLYEEILKEADLIFNKIKSSWHKDSSHSQFVLTNGFDKKILFSSGIEEEFKKLKDRILFIKNFLEVSLNDKKKMYWNMDNKDIKLIINSYKPVDQIKICLDVNERFEKDLVLENNQKYFVSILKKNNCYIFDLILNSNRLKVPKNNSRVTTFMASDGFKIQPTNFTFKTSKNIKIQKIMYKNLGEDTFYILNKNYDLIGSSNSVNNLPYKLKEEKKQKIWQGDIFIDNLLVVDKPLKISPGTNIYLSANASIIFKDNVISIGSEKERINFIKKEEDPWGVISLIGDKTKGSIFKFNNFSGGSGGNYDGFEFTGMFNIYSSENIELSNLSFSKNFYYDDLIHILYSSNIRLADSIIFDGRSDLIDIDISDMKIENCIFINSGNDAIDSMTSKVKILNTKIDRAGDKGVSAGESSLVSIFNLTLNNTQIAIQSKDGTNVKVFNSKFLNNKAQLDAYQKNWRYGSGGDIEVKDSFFKGNKNLISAKNKSKITISNSVFNKPFSHLKTKKVKLVDNYIRK
tara:strand:- start:9753 stop:12422 length:2670 start_codon:yes stop_codon:yes gene_type:complete